MASSLGVVIASNQSPVSVAGTLNIAGNPSISGTVQAQLQSTNASVITVAQSSIAVAIVSGSIAATFTPPANQSVSGTVGASIIGLPPVNVVGTPSISGAVTVVGATIPPGSVSGTVGASVIGTVPITQSGTIIASIVSTVPSSVLVGASIFGALPAGNAVLGAVAASISGTVATTLSGNPSVSGTVGASIVGQLPAGTAVIGSVAVLQGTTPWLISSVYGNISGSVVAFQGTNPWIIGSIVGTYGEDIPSTAADKGLFTLGIRNDTVASLVGTDLDYTGWSTDSAGRHLMKPFSADEARLDTVSSTVSTSVTALFNSVAGLRLYVTDVMIANTGSVATLITFKDGSTSILGYTIAPAGGGSNINGMAFPMRTAPGQDFAYVNATASSVLYVTAKGYRAP